MLFLLLLIGFSAIAFPGLGTLIFKFIKGKINIEPLNESTPGRIQYDTSDKEPTNRGFDSSQPNFHKVDIYNGQIQTMPSPKQNFEIDPAVGIGTNGHFNEVSNRASNVLCGQTSKPNVEKYKHTSDEKEGLDNFSPEKKLFIKDCESYGQEELEDIIAHSDKCRQELANSMREFERSMFARRDDASSKSEQAHDSVADSQKGMSTGEMMLDEHAKLPEIEDKYLATMGGSNQALSRQEAHGCNALPKVNCVVEGLPQGEKEIFIQQPKVSELSKGILDQIKAGDPLTTVMTEEQVADKKVQELNALSDEKRKVLTSNSPIVESEKTQRSETLLPEGKKIQESEALIGEKIGVLDKRICDTTQQISKLQRDIEDCEQAIRENKTIANTYGLKIKNFEGKLQCFARENNEFKVTMTKINNDQSTLTNSTELHKCEQNVAKHRETMAAASSQLENLKELNKFYEESKVQREELKVLSDKITKHKCDLTKLISKQKGYEKNFDEMSMYLISGNQVTDILKMKRGNIERLVADYKCCIETINAHLQQVEEIEKSLSTQEVFFRGQSGKFMQQIKTNENVSETINEMRKTLEDMKKEIGVAKSMQSGKSFGDRCSDRMAEIDSMIKGRGVDASVKPEEDQYFSQFESQIRDNFEQINKKDSEFKATGKDVNLSASAFDNRYGDGNGKIDIDELYSEYMAMNIDVLELSTISGDCERLLKESKDCFDNLSKINIAEPEKSHRIRSVEEVLKMSTQIVRTMQQVLEKSKEDVDSRENKYSKLAETHEIDLERSILEHNRVYNETIREMLENMQGASNEASQFFCNLSVSYQNVLEINTIIDLFEDDLQSKCLYLDSTTRSTNTAINDARLQSTDSNIQCKIFDSAKKNEVELKKLDDDIKLKEQLQENFSMLMEVVQLFYRRLKCQIYIFAISHNVEIPESDANYCVSEEGKKPLMLFQQMSESKKEIDALLEEQKTGDCWNKISCVLKESEDRFSVETIKPDQAPTPMAKLMPKQTSRLEK